MNTNQKIDTFISKYPKNVQEILQKIKSCIQEEVPEAEETIVYGIPTFKLNGKNLVHFSAFKNHIGFYPTPSGIVAFKNELSQYKTAKGSVQFPLNKSIPFEMIKKIIKFRALELLNTANK